MGKENITKKHSGFLNMHLKLNKNLLIFMPNYQSYPHMCQKFQFFWDELAKEEKQHRIR